jgi:DNA-binding MarR family transcriptional regulator
VSGRTARRGHRDTASTAETDFDLLPGLVGFHLRFAQNAVVDHFVRHVADGSVTPIQFSTLALTGANPGLSQTVLARALGIERSSTVSIIDGLEGRGLLERRRPDRRSHALFLTAAGTRLLARLKPRVAAHDEAIAVRLSAAEKATLVDLLDRLARD